MSRYHPEPDPFPSPLRARVAVTGAVRSDRGLERGDNQDRAALGEAARGASWEPPAAVDLCASASSFYGLVCDGMGGEAGGALASGLAVETIVAAMRAFWMHSNAQPPASLAVAEADVERAVVASLEAASARIRRVALEDRAYARMGTTATLALVAHGTLVCAQVGDSRAYVLRGERLMQVTEDQTLVEMLRKAGTPPEQVRAMVGPNVILQALGSTARLQVAVTRTTLAHGDVVLLCSDGLHGVVADEEIARLLRAGEDLPAACDALVARANALGGPDNISCVLFRVAGPAFARAPVSAG